MIRKILASLAAGSLLLVGISFAEDVVNGTLSHLSFVDQANAATSTGGVSLTTTVQQTITLTMGTSTIALGSLTPGTPIFATTSATIASNNMDGITLQTKRDDVTTTLVHSDTTTTFPDATSWASGSSNATTTNLVGANLHFKVANTGTDAGLYSSTFWGPSDTDGASNAKYGGFPATSETVASNAGYVGADQIVVMRVRMDAPGTQKSGAYTGGTTFTAFANP